MKKRMLVMLTGVGVVFGGIVAYQVFNAYMMQKYFSANAQPSATVTAMQASRQSWQPTLRAVGSLRAVQGVQISSEVAGMVSTVHVQSGQRVKAGDVLFELNHADDAAELRSLQADAVLARLNFKRDEGQFAAQAISQAQFDTSKAALQRSLAAVARQKALIAKKRIRAPFAGRLGIVALNPGQYVNPADAITTLQNSAALFVDFYLPQKNIGGIAENQRIRVSSDAWSAKQFSGKITAISSAVDSNTRNVRIEGRIDNRDGLLYPGMFASVAVENGAPQHYLTLPQTA
ncbi:MAG: efflux RND transporter periplasmic adaptor subunit, partial [Mariprofundaceae bacterium]|nr:efflux RND transporter periplasmic adaptor subunit [Mariprofundaceae bacterium]